MPAYDGTIRIDSGIDTKGFNAGISKLSASTGKFKNLLGSLDGTGSKVIFSLVKGFVKLEVLIGEGHVVKTETCKNGDNHNGDN